MEKVLMVPDDADAINALAERAWVHSKYSHSLFEKAGVRCTDFVGLMGIVEFANKTISVWTLETDEHSFAGKEWPGNLIRFISHASGYHEYYFEPVR